MKAPFIPLGANFVFLWVNCEFTHYCSDLMYFHKNICSWRETD